MTEKKETPIRIDDGGRAYLAVFASVVLGLLTLYVVLQALAPAPEAPVIAWTPRQIEIQVRDAPLRRANRDLTRLLDTPVEPEHMDIRPNAANAHELRKMLEK